MLHRVDYILDNYKSREKELYEHLLSLYSDKNENNEDNEEDNENSNQIGIIGNIQGSTEFSYRKSFFFNSFKSDEKDEQTDSNVKFENNPMTNGIIFNTYRKSPNKEITIKNDRNIHIIDKSCINTSYSTINQRLSMQRNNDSSPHINHNTTSNYSSYDSNTYQTANNDNLSLFNQDIERTIRDLLEEHSPSMHQFADRMLLDYLGRESVLLSALKKEFGVTVT